MTDLGPVATRAVRLVETHDPHPDCDTCGGTGWTPTGSSYRRDCPCCEDQFSEPTTDDLLALLLERLGPTAPLVSWGSGRPLRAAHLTGTAELLLAGCDHLVADEEVLRGLEWAEAHWDATRSAAWACVIGVLWERFGRGPREPR